MKRITVQMEVIFLGLLLLSLLVATFSGYHAVSTHNVYGQDDVKTSVQEVSTHIDQAYNPLPRL